MSWPIFLAAFSFIFLAALPGRTTLVMLLMAARGRPWGIFLGAALAFACQSFISVMLGRVLAFIPQHWIQFATGLLFLFFAFLFWREASHEKTQLADDATGVSGGFATVVRSSFFLIFAAEWGDVSQVAIASLSARHPEQMTVLLSAVLALWMIAAIAVTVGSRLHRVVSPTLIQKVASVVFVVIGIYLIVSSAASKA